MSLLSCQSTGTHQRERKGVEVCCVGLPQLVLVIFSAPTLNTVLFLKEPFSHRVLRLTCIKLYYHSTNDMFDKEVELFFVTAVKLQAHLSTLQN